MGDRTVSTRAYAAAFNLKGGMQEKRVSSTDTQTHRSLLAGNSVLLRYFTLMVPEVLLEWLKCFPLCWVL